MTTGKPQPDAPPRVLATDLDGTLIPLPDHPAQIEALDALHAYRRELAFILVFATGRHFASVIEAIAAHRLPSPDWIICDVGAAIHRRSGSEFAVFTAYGDHLAELTEGVGRDVIVRELSGIAGLAPQPPDHQQRFKISYESSPQAMDRLVDAVRRRLAGAGLPYDCLGSRDPFVDRAWLDVLPRGVAKAYALNWLATHADFEPGEVIYAGDSGNDLAALVGGFRAIVVANGVPGLADQVADAHREQDLRGRLYLASQDATSGVVEGCRHFGLFPA